MSYGNKIKELRQKHSLTQSELANKLFVSRQAVSLWEQDKAEPSKDTLLLLKEQYGISIDEWATENEAASSVNASNPIFKKIFNIKTLLIILGIIVGIAVIVVASINLSSRYKILHPENFDNDTVITRKENLLITQGNASTIAFNENGKPTIICTIPEGFEASTDTSGQYYNGNGNFISFNSAFEENAFNPLYGSEYYSFYENKGYDSYIGMAQMAMYVDFNKTSIFSKRENIYLAGGSRIIREYICSKQNADYYSIDGGLTQDGKAMRIYGFALHFENITWFIALEDCNGHQYYISIKDPDGIGASIETIGEFLSSMVITEPKNTTD